jgi:hypothetical protein
MILSGFTGWKPLPLWGKQDAAGAQVENLCRY